MKKKEYIQPDVKAIRLESTVILAGSTGTNSFDNGIQSLSDDEDEREDVVFE